MRNLLRSLSVLAMTALGAFAAGAGGGSVQAANPKVNSCGCYRDLTGSCFCGKKSKCDCPGDCEPRGCEEKRAREIEKEVEAETKRARDVERKQREAEEERRKKAETPSNEEELAAEARLQSAENEADGDSNGAAAEGATKNRKSKSSRGEKKGHSAEESRTAGNSTGSSTKQ